MHQIKKTSWKKKYEYIDYINQRIIISCEEIMPYKNPMDFSIGPKHITKYTTNHIFLSKYTNACTLHTPNRPISFNSFEKSRAAVIQSIKDTNHCGRARRSRNTCPTRYSCSSGCCSSWYFRLELQYLAQLLGCYQNLRPLGCGNSWLS